MKKATVLGAMGCFNVLNFDMGKCPLGTLTRRFESTRTEIRRKRAD